MMRRNLSVVPSPDSPKSRPFKRISELLVVDETTGIYYAAKSYKRYRIPRLYRSTKETKINKARAVAEAYERDHLDKYLGGSRRPGDLGSLRSGKAFGDVIDEVLAVVTPTKRPGTQDMHRNYLGELKREWRGWEVGRMTRSSVATWFVDFKRRKNRRTFADYQKHLNLVLRYAYQQGYTNSLVTIPNPDPVRGEIGRVYTHSEIKGLWKAMNEETSLQFALSFECFMRLREVLHLTWDRVDLKAGTITLRAQDVKTGSKTGRGRTFKVSPKALAMLKHRRRMMPRARYVFPSPLNPNQPVNQNKTAWKVAKKAAGIKGRARWHDLRHTALTMALLDHRLDPVLVSEYAGLSLRTLQQVYLHSTAEKTASVAQAISIGADDDE